MFPRHLAPAAAWLALVAAPAAAPAAALPGSAGISPSADKPETFAARTVTVAFAEAPGEKFVADLHALMGTRTLMKHDAARWAFGLPAHGAADDWSAFFAMLPRAKFVTPAPRANAADGAVPPVVLGPASPGPGVYLPVDQLLASSHVLVRFRGPFAGEADLAARVDRVYGTRALGRTDGGETRLEPPKGVTPQAAARALRLCPRVASAEPSWGR